MSRAMVELLTREMDAAWKSFRDALEGLTEDEYHWRPAADALTLDDLLPPDSEDWRSFYAKFPSPPPLSTIEHKVGHVATCKIMYAEYAFREGRLSWRWSDLRVPRAPDAMRAYLGDAHRTLRGYLDGLVDPATRIFWRRGRPTGGTSGRRSASCG